MSETFDSVIGQIYNEARVLSLTKEEDNQIKKLLERYKSIKKIFDEAKIKDLTKVSAKQKAVVDNIKIEGKPLKIGGTLIEGDAYYGFYLPSINFTNRSVPGGKVTRAKVFVNFLPTHSNLEAMYIDKKVPFIIINDAHVNGDLASLYSLLVHELGHSVQNYKEQTPEYVQAYNNILKGLDWSKVDYYTDPSELEVQVGEIVANTRFYFDNEYIKYQKLNGTNGYPKRGWETRREQILLELKNFFSSPPKNYLEYRELKLPPYLKRSQEFLETISTLYYGDEEKLKKPWRKLQLALYTLYKDLETKYTEQT